MSRIDVYLSQRHSVILRFRAPATLSAARFSLEYFVAAAPIGERVGLDYLTTEALRRQECLALMEKITRHNESKPDPAMEGFAWVRIWEEVKKPEISESTWS